jgi:hypothetical protein
LKKLVEAQVKEAEKAGLPAFKYATNDEMLGVMGYIKPVWR